MSSELTAVQRLLLDALRGTGKWMTRSDIADQIGRPTRLNPNDIEMLERLVKQGLVEKKQRIRPGATVWEEYIYRHFSPGKTRLFERKPLVLRRFKSS